MSFFIDYEDDRNAYELITKHNHWLIIIICQGLVDS